MIRPIRTDEHAALLAVAVATGLFAPDDAEALLGGVVDGLAVGSLPPGHAAIACVDAATDVVQGWAYYAPDAYAADVWNLWWIGVDPAFHGTGAGRALLGHVESDVAKRSGRVVVIETSDGDALARARAFYARRGYAERGRVPDFFAPGEAKVIFSRTLGASAARD